MLGSAVGAWDGPSVCSAAGRSTSGVWAGFGAGWAATSVSALGSAAAGAAPLVAVSAADAAGVGEAGLGAAGLGPDGVGPDGVGPDGVGAVALGCAGGVGPGFLAGAFFDAFLPMGSLASRSFSRRSTGASTVDDADRTNSPMSFNVFRTSLLVTPSSFASS